MADTSPLQFAIKLDKERFTFCAAHFITFGDNVCESLHGHNYGVTAEVGGPLGEHGYVVDFIAVRENLVKLTQALDHRVLLPTQHPAIKVIVAGNAAVARFEERRWVFPHSDCVLLPITNTTAELLAKYLLDQLVAELSKLTTITSANVTVDECHGQQASCYWRAN